MSIKQLRHFAKKCVNNYAIHNNLDNFYKLSVDALPDFEQHEFAALIIADEPAYASEANGPDNDLWKSRMLPALTHYLKNSTDRDEEREFNQVWTDCVTHYMKPKMQELIDDALSDFNSDNGYTKTFANIHGVHAHGSI